MDSVADRLARALSDRYRIERELGEGGMATVYLAEDLKHDRRVALKVLKPELAAVLGGDRFVVEIKTTASLQHPHILPLFDSGTADGFLFYVMPYIEGETLRDKLNRETQLGIDEAVRVTCEIADALDYAHRNGVIHRDIKPENILLHDGRPMVADFGIALALSAAAGGRMTETGTSIGTPHYMSPEQATGDKQITGRADQYSLASLLYEMLAGEPPHTGASAQAVIMKIIAEPVKPVTELRKTVPRNVAAALAKALEKLPADRFDTSASFAAALKDPSFATTHATGASPVTRTKAAFLPWGLLAAAVLALVYVIARGPSQDDSSGAPLIRASLNLAGNQVLTGSIGISGDGRVIAVQGSEDGVEKLLVRNLSEERFTALPNTEGGQLPFLSPDGSQIAFRATSGLRQVAASGGPATVIDADGDWGKGDWTADGTLYYSRSYLSGIWRKSPDAAPEMLTQPDSAELAHWNPQLMPDGRHLLFTAFRTPIDSAGIVAFDLDTGERRTVLRGALDGRYVPTGHLLFARANTIYAIAFDPATMETSGQAVAVIEDVKVFYEDGYSSFAVSGNGIAVYVRGSEYDAPSDLVWVDRGGVATPAADDAAVWAAPTISPDGQSIAVAKTEPGESADVWVLGLARGSRTRLTVGGGADFQPIWSPDGKWIIYASETPVFDLFRVRADGSGSREALVHEPFDAYPFTFTADGSRLIFEANTLPRTSIKSVALDGSRSIDTVPTPPAGNQRSPRLAPGGRLIAYVSGLSGRDEVYVASWPGMGNRQTVSLNGGTEPHWTKGGRELVFRHGNTFLAVSVDPETAELGTPQPLFSAPAPVVSGDPARTTYDVSPDGDRFIMVTRPPERAPRRVMVITDFFEILKRAVPN